MKNLFKVFGIIALVAVIGFSFAACGNGTTDDNSNNYPQTQPVYWPDNLIGFWSKREIGYYVEFTNYDNYAGFRLGSDWYDSLTKIEDDIYTLKSDISITLKIETDGKLTISSIVNDSGEAFREYFVGTYTKDTTN